MGNWNSICQESIRKERKAIEERYGIRFDQTEIYCSGCGRPVANSLNHTCQDIRLQKLKKAKISIKKTPRMDVSLSQDEFEALTP